MEVKTLEGTSIEQVHAAFSKAFSDYTEPWNKTVDELQHMLERRGYTPGLSFGAFEKGELVSFVLNGIGDWNDRLTAYDTGTGTIKDYRKQGLVTRILNESIPALQRHGITQYLLEVIRINTGAFELYKKQGFEVVRELDYFILEKDKIVIQAAKQNEEYLIKNIAPDWEVFKTFWEFEPSWQNSIDAIGRALNHFDLLGVFHNGTPVGYGIIEPATGDIPQLAIAYEHRQKGLGTRLLHQLLQSTNAPVIKFINSNAAYLPFRKFMESIGLQPGHGQYEMIRKL